MRKNADDSNREAAEIGKLGGCGVSLLRPFSLKVSGVSTLFVLSKLGLIEARIKAIGVRNPVSFLALYPFWPPHSG